MQFTRPTFNGASQNNLRVFGTLWVHFRQIRTFCQDGYNRPMHIIQFPPFCAPPQPLASCILAALWSPAGSFNCCGLRVNCWSATDWKKTFHGKPCLGQKRLFSFKSWLEISSPAKNEAQDDFSWRGRVSVETYTGRQIRGQGHCCETFNTLDKIWMQFMNLKQSIRLNQWWKCVDRRTVVLCMTKDTSCNISKLKMRLKLCNCCGFQVNC